MTKSLKSRLAAGETCLGVWCGMTDPTASEMAGQAGFDWVMIDGEHGPQTLSTIGHHLRSLAGTKASPCVRVPVAEDWVLKQVLDLGAHNVLIPMIHDADAAKRAVAACRYPPHGTRGVGAAVARASGFGRDSSYMQTAQDSLCIMVQAESRAAVENIDAIAATDGVDVVFIGPADLAADMGHPGDMGHRDVVAAIDHMIDRIIAAGKTPGTVVFSKTEATRMAAKGVRFLGIGADVLLLRAALEQCHAQVADGLG